VDVETFAELYREEEVDSAKLVTDWLGKRSKFAVLLGFPGEGEVIAPFPSFSLLRVIAFGRNGFILEVLNFDSLSGGGGSIALP
jgi:hypothetical protein